VPDALHCNAETAQVIVQEGGADYLLPVKGNQPGVEENLAAIERNLQRAFSPSTADGRRAARGTQ
jgi:hypothetical protein